MSKSNNPSPSHPLADPDVLARFDAVRRAHAVYREQQSELEAILRAEIQKLVQPGTVVDLSHDNRKCGNVPSYLARETVVQGNTRNATAYRIESIQDIEVNLSNPALSTWACSAAPISPVTGKPMSGRVAKSMSYGASSDRSLVTLKFRFGSEED